MRVQTFKEWEDQTGFKGTFNERTRAYNEYVEDYHKRYGHKQLPTTQVQQKVKAFKKKYPLSKAKLTSKEWEKFDKGKKLQNFWDWKKKYKPKMKDKEAYEEFKKYLRIKPLKRKVIFEKALNEDIKKYGEKSHKQMLQRMKKRFPNLTKKEVGWFGNQSKRLRFEDYDWRKEKDPMSGHWTTLKESEGKKGKSSFKEWKEINPEMKEIPYDEQIKAYQKYIGKKK